MAENNRNYTRVLKSIHNTQCVWTQSRKDLLSVCCKLWYGGFVSSSCGSRGACCRFHTISWAVRNKRTYFTKPNVLSSPAPLDAKLVPAVLSLTSFRSELLQSITQGCVNLRVPHLIRIPIKAKLALLATMWYDMSNSLMGLSLLSQLYFMKKYRSNFT